MDFWDSVDEIIKQKDNIRKNVVVKHNDNSTAKHNDVKQEDVDQNAKKVKEVSDISAEVVLLTAVEDEYKAARAVFENPYSENFANGFKYCMVSCKVAKDKEITIAIFKQNNMGLVSASMTATYAVNKFNPQMILMCGVCAGVEDKVNLGDLIVFSPVYDYGAGKYNKGQFFPDYRQRQLNGTIRPIVEKMCSDTELAREIKDTWKFHTGKPDTELVVHIYPGGSGAAVVTDEAVVEEIKSHQRNLGAIDMESYAVAEVANVATAREIPWLVVKGVQDFASPLKNDQYREYAAYVSAVFMKKFLENIYL